MRYFTILTIALGGMSLLLSRSAVAMPSVAALADLNLRVADTEGTARSRQHWAGFEGALERLSGRARARAEAVERIQKESRSEAEALQQEHRRLMLEAGADGETGPDGKWAVALYANISRQAQLKDLVVDRIARWDAEHPVEVAVSSDGFEIGVEPGADRGSIAGRDGQNDFLNN